MDLEEKQKRIELILTKEIVKQTRRTSNLIDLTDALLQVGESSFIKEYNILLLEGRMKRREDYLKSIGDRMNESEQHMWEELFDILDSDY